MGEEGRGQTGGSKERTATAKQPREKGGKREREGGKNQMRMKMRI